MGIDRLVFLALAVAVCAGAVWSFRLLRRGRAHRPQAALPAVQATLVSSSDPAAPPPLPVGEAGGSCARCRRSFDVVTKFCPFDGDPLGAAAQAMPPLPLVLAGGARHGGKICPHCTERYRADEAFCGRDGTELVTVN